MMYLLNLLLVGTVWILCSRDILLLRLRVRASKAVS
uniref:Uncharacterized protein n=1 Tax=Siphoviridae sp. cteoh1 TaxID=2826407 RepID=A0A8S5QLT1_9CAUD|nr:MAG TPA: hypothetical protein [Siphoviridae sp. cteoh1]